MRHIKHTINGLAALIAVALFTVGVPAGLIAYVGWPLPTAIPTIDQIRLALHSGIDPHLVINTLAVVVWVIWVQLLAVLIAETIAAVRGHAAHRLPVLPGLQPFVAQLVAAITLAVAVAGPLRAMPAAATPLAQQLSLPSSYPVVDLAEEPAAASPIAAGDRRAEDPKPTYIVDRHDTLWKIAETTLGDGRRWKEIQTLNSGRTMNDGQHFTPATQTLTAGWRLILPTDAAIPDADPSVQAGTSVVVEEGDSFWSIAETTLDNAWSHAPTDGETAEYWSQLVDANRDTLEPPYDPNLIYPGQHFELPPIPAAANATEAGNRAPTSSGEITVEPGDNMWTMAETVLSDAWGRTPGTAEITSYWDALVEVNRDRLAPPHDPDLIHPGQVFLLPPIPDDPEATPQPEPEQGPTLDPVVPPPTTAATTDELPVPTTVATPAPTTTTDSRNHTEVTQPTVEVTDVEDDIDSEATGLAGELFPNASKLAGLAILATGLVALIRRLRASQLRHRRPGTVPTAPPPETTATETTLRTAAAPTATEFIDLALRAMAHNITSGHLPPPHIVGVHLTAEALRLLLWTPHTNPPPGWNIDDEGRSWTLPTSADIAQLQHKAQRTPAPYPTLVTVGHGDRSQLLLDLEFLGATQITGQPGDVTATCSTIATELATTPLADNLQIVCVGFGADLQQLERITVVDDLTDVLGMIETKAAAVASAPGGSVLEGRLSPANDGTWDPIVILHPAEQTPAEANRLLTIAHAGHGVAAIVGYPTGDRWQLQVHDNTIRIEPLGQTYQRRNLTSEEQTAVADLVAAAKDPEGMPADLADDPLSDIDTLDDTTDTWQEPVEQTLFPNDQPSVKNSSVDAPEMKLLGTLRVDGTARDFPLIKCAEYVAYLTFHRRGVEADTLMEALWPEEPPNNDRLNRHTSKTRTALGTGPDGKPYLPYITGGLYRISPHVRNDLERFTDYIQQADRTTGGEQAQHLHAALELVEGTPFSGAGNGYTWAHTAGIITHTIVAIDNAAHRLAQHALDNNDPDQATWASRKGLLATGACEACYRNLMRAAATQGNQVAFEATYRELLAVTDADQGPDAAAYLDPETTELYEHESRERRRQVG